MAALLTDQALREDARCALTRHPAPGAVKALKAAFATGGELAGSLRRRGESDRGLTSAGARGLGLPWRGGGSAPRRVSAEFPGRLAAQP